MHAKFRLTTAGERTAWDAFVERSPQGTLFSTWDYLDAAGVRCARLFVCKGSEVRAAVSLTLSPDGCACDLDWLVIYNGLMFRDPTEENASRARQERFDITEFVIGELTRQYRTVALRLSPAVEDVRPFLWHNFGSPESPRFTIDLRYTSIVDISDFRELRGMTGLVTPGIQTEEELSLFRGLDDVRRRDIRGARKLGCEVETGGSPRHFVPLYGDMMRAQGAAVDHERLGRLGRLLDGLAAAKRLVIFTAFGSERGRLYTVLFGLDSKRAYYLFGGGPPGGEERYAGTIALWDALRMLATRFNVRQVDLEGVNSPQRGAFKLGFGGSLTPYFRVTLGSQNAATRARVEGERA